MDPATVTLFSATWKVAGAVGVLALLLVVFAVYVLRWMAGRIQEAEARALVREQDLTTRVRQLEDRQHAEITELAKTVAAALEMSAEANKRSAEALDRSARAFEHLTQNDSGRHPTRRPLPHLTPI